MLTLVPKPNQRRRMDFGHFVDRIFWGILTATAIYASNQLKSVSESVSELNIKMSTIVEKISSGEKRVDALDKRIERLEDIRLKN